MPSNTTYGSVIGGLLIWGAGAAQAAGFAIIEQGVTGLGNAYAGSAAVAADESTIYYNPAGLTRLQRPGLLVGGHVIAPQAKFSDDGSHINPMLGNAALFGTRGGDGGETVVVPNLYYARPLTGRLHLGLGIYAPFGLSTDYNDDWIGRYHALNSDLRTIDVNPALALEVNDRLSLGLGLVARYGDAELGNAIDFGSVCIGTVAAALGLSSADAAGRCASDGLSPLRADGRQRLSGDDWGYGYTLGALVSLSDRTRIGLAYRSRVDLRLEGDVDFTLPAAGAGTTSGNILAAAFTDTPASADLELPETASVSLVHEVYPALELLADLTYTRWDRFRELRVKLANGLPDSVQPEHWQNTWRYSLGANWRLDDAWTLRGGMAYDETPIPGAALRTPRVPGQDRTWLAFGLSHRPDASLRVDLGYAHLFVRDTAIDNTETTTGHVLSGRYVSSVDIFSAQVGWWF